MERGGRNADLGIRGNPRDFPLNEPLACEWTPMCFFVFFFMAEVASAWIYLRTKGGLSHFLPKFEHIFVADITFPPFLLCRYFYYQLVAYCVCFKMICKKSL